MPSSALDLPPFTDLLKQHRFEREELEYQLGIIGVDADLVRSLLDLVLTQFYRAELRGAARPSLERQVELLIEEAAASAGR